MRKIIRKKLNAYEIDVKKIDIGVGGIDDTMCGEKIV